MVSSIADVTLFTVLLALYIYICALLGMEMFAHYAQFNEEGEMVNDDFAAEAKGQKMSPPRANFDTIGSAVTAVWILILGEDWPFVMYDYIRVYGVGTTVAAGV